jgi:uncharacterized membrane protein
LPANLNIPLEFGGGIPWAVSFDGKVIAGEFFDRTSQGSYLWSDEHQLEYLPSNTIVAAVSSNGVAVGFRSMTESGDSDFVWDRRHGARHLRTILATHGLRLPPDTQIIHCEEISADGRVIMGLSTDSRGEGSVFRAVLPSSAFE